jgi:hypothetical protein
MARPSKHDGVVYRRGDSEIWWMRYRDASDGRRRETTNTDDWDEAQRRLRERLCARDNRALEVVRRGEQLTFQDWSDSFMENYSKPPIRAPNTHEANERAMKHLQATFGSWRLVDVTGRHRAISESSAQETRPCEDKGRFSGAGNPQGHKRASGVPGIAPGAERGGEEEIPAGEPLCGRRVSGNDSLAIT